MKNTKYLGLTLFPEDHPGKSVAVCEVTDLSELAAASRALVWSLLEWKFPKVGGIEPVAGEPTENGQVTTFTYPAMPKSNESFGNYKTEDNKGIRLRFKDRHEWVYTQDVQFRYKREGSGAANQHHALENGVWKHVNQGDPNWYVYWTQVAIDFGFGPQTKMSYNHANTHPSGAWAKYNIRVIGNNYEDDIVLYNICRSSIMQCIKLIHHENGHRQSRQLPNVKGGWGEALNYDQKNDDDDDFVHNVWKSAGNAEANPPVPPGFGYTVGFRMGVNDHDRLTAWDHGWGPDDGPPWSRFVKPNSYDEETGCGICARNEELVENERDNIRKKDWSY